MQLDEIRYVARIIAKCLLCVICCTLRTKIVSNKTTKESTIKFRTNKHTFTENKLTNFKYFLVFLKNYNYRVPLLTFEKTFLISGFVRIIENR